MAGYFRSIQALADWVDCHRYHSIALAVSLTALIAISDWAVGANVSFGVLYTFPLLVASLAISRAAILLLGLVCALLREAFGPFQWQPDYALRVALVGGAFSAVGILVAELNRNRKLAVENLRQLKQFRRAQQESRRQLSTLLDTSPLPILLADGSGSIIVANEACRQLLDLSEHDRASLFDYLPELEGELRASPERDRMRREIECTGRTRSGEPFFAHLWLTAYRTGGGLRMAVVLWDASEDLRGREIANVESIVASSSVLLAAFAHEVKNLSAAAVTLCSRLAARCQVQQDGEYRAAAGALEGLSGLATSALRLGARRTDAVFDLGATMQQIRIVLQPLFDAEDVQVVWNVPEQLPTVCGDHSALVQTFLNLARNGIRATRGRLDRQFRVDAAEPARDPNYVTLTVRDNGPGVAHPEALFQPFRSGSGGAGLGLFVSRANLRSCRGDLSYEPGSGGGACFTIRLKRA